MPTVNNAEASFGNLPAQKPANGNTIAMPAGAAAVTRAASFAGIPYATKYVGRFSSREKFGNASM